MNEVIENIVPWLEVLENAIFSDDECPSDFERTFCEGNELISVSFNSGKFEVHYVLSSGQHCVYSFPLEELSKWLDK